MGIQLSDSACCAYLYAFTKAQSRGYFFNLAFNLLLIFIITTSTFAFPVIAEASVERPNELQPANGFQSVKSSVEGKDASLLRIPVDDLPGLGGGQRRPQPQAADLIFADDFESGDLSAWSSVVTDGGDLSAAPSIDMQGGYVLQALIDSNDGIYVVDETPVGAARYRARFYFDPHSIAMANLDTHILMQGLDTAGEISFQLELRFYLGDYLVRMALFSDDDTYFATSWVRLTDQMHYLEMDWLAATSAGADDGGLTFYLDGVETESISGADNDTRTIEKVYLGAVGDIDDSTRGSYFFDAFESRSETYIGPDPTAPEPPEIVPPDMVFADAFESGDLSAWSQAETDAGDLSASQAAALVGRWGLEAIIDDTNPIYVTDWSPYQETRYRARFYFDPHSLGMGNNRQQAFLIGYEGSATPILKLSLHYKNGQYSLLAEVWLDSGLSTTSGLVPLADAPHRIEFDWAAATGVGADDGAFTLWLDGTEEITLTGLDTDGRYVDYLTLGVVGNVDSKNSGSLYFDAFQSRRATAIGAVGEGPNPSAGRQIIHDDRYPSIFTGQLRTSYPLWTPPGRAGMAPGLALSYASGTLDGLIGDVQSSWVGAGWNLSGVEIVRTITTDETQYGYEDSFVLSFGGVAHPLVVDPGTPGRYRTEEESFLYIQRHSPALGNEGDVANATSEWWEIVATDGTRYRLGWNLDSEQVVPMPGYECVTGSPCTAPEAPFDTMGYAGTGAGLVALRWRMDRVVDTHGNFVSYQYTEEQRSLGGLAFDSASYLTSARYTGHLDGSGAVDIPPAYELRLVLQPRQGDYAQGGLWAWDLAESYQLDGALACYGDCDSGTLVRSTDFEYELMTGEQPGGTLVLRSITASGGGYSDDGRTIVPATAPRMRFTYQLLDNLDEAACPDCGQAGYPRLVRIENGTGGSTQYAWEHDSPAGGDAYAWRVQSISSYAGASLASKVARVYESPAYDADNILTGYGAVEEWAYDENGSTLLTRARHEYGTAVPEIGRRLAARTFDPSGTELRRTTFEFTTDNDAMPPGVLFRYLSLMRQYERSSSGLNQISQTAITRDEVTGQVTQQREYDGLALYRQIDLEYADNLDPTVWILGAVTHQTLSNAYSTVMGETFLYYDDGLYGQAPTQGELSLVQARTGEGSDTVDTGYGHDDYGNLTEVRAYEGYGTSMTIPSGSYLSTSVAYETTLHTYPASVTNPLLQSTSLDTLYTLGLTWRVTDPNELETTSDFDGLGRITQQFLPGVSGPARQVTYPPLNAEGMIDAPYGVLTQVRDLLGPGAPVFRDAWTVFDGLGRAIQSQAADGTGNLLISDTDYGPQGVERQGVARTEVGVGGSWLAPNWGEIPYVANVYDALGRILSMTRPGGETTSYEYDGLVTASIDPNGHRLERSYDPFSRVLEVREYEGTDPWTLYSNTTYDYDIADRMTDIHDALANDTVIVFDWLGRKTSMDDPNAGLWDYDYNALSQLTLQTDARGCTTGMTYDDLGRPLTKVYGGPAECSSTPAVAYSYDDTTGGNLGIGRRTGMIDGTGTTSWFFSDYGYNVKETRDLIGAPEVYTMTTQTDWIGRVSSLTYPDGEVVGYGYDAFGRQDGVASNVAGSIADLAFNDHGQTSQMDLGNGWVVQTCYDSVTLRLDNKRAYDGSAVACGTATPGGAVIDFSYAYDGVGNILNIWDAARGERFDYAYDQLDRLVQAGGLDASQFLYVEGYDYNAVGALTETSTWNMEWAQAGAYEDDFSGLWYVGDWAAVSDASASGGARTETSVPGASTRLMFTGGGVSYIRPVGPDQGMVEIYINGALADTVDNYAETYADQVAYEISAGVVGDHLLELRASDQKNPASGGYDVSLDALVVLPDLPGGESMAIEGDAPPETTPEQEEPLDVGIESYTGPDRTITTWVWKCKRCRYLATIPGYSCTLTLYYTPTTACPSTTAVRGLFTASACSWPAGCTAYGSQCVVTKTGDAVITCNPGDPGCTLIPEQSTLPPATVAGTFACDTPLANGWCAGGARIDLEGHEPLEGYVITQIEGDPGVMCDPPDAPDVSCQWTDGPEGEQIIEFWAVSSYGDTSLKGSVTWRLDTTPPTATFVTPPEGVQVVAGGTYTFQVSGSDDSSGVASAEITLDGGQIWLPMTLNGGLWEYDWDTTVIDDGTYPVAARVTDTVGHVSAETNAAVVVRNNPGPLPAARTTDPAHPHAVSQVINPDGTIDTYGYDESGNMTTRTEGGEEYTQEFGGNGRMTSVTNWTTGETWTFGYDGDGGRVRQDNPDGTATLYLFGGMYEVQLGAGGAQTSVHRYYFVGGRRVALRDGAGMHYIITDHLGSTNAVLDGTGAVEYEQRYLPYGQPRLDASGNPIDFGYTGQRESDTGLMDYNARWFDARIGQFASADSLMVNPLRPRALNRYGYVVGNPISYIDSSGYVVEIPLDLALPILVEDICTIDPKSCLMTPIDSSTPSSTIATDDTDNDPGDYDGGEDDEEEDDDFRFAGFRVELSGWLFVGFDIDIDFLINPNWLQTGDEPIGRIRVGLLLQGGLGWGLAGSVGPLFQKNINTLEEYENLNSGWGGSGAFGDVGVEVNRVKNIDDWGIANTPEILYIGYDLGGELGFWGNLELHSWDFDIYQPDSSSDVND